MRVRFQADADLDARILRGSRRAAPEIDIRTAADAGLAGLEDPEVLRMAAESRRILVSQDRRTMPAQFASFSAQSPGLLAYSSRCRQTLGVLIELIATASDRLVISAPFLQPGAGISGGVLNAALSAALQRGVAVELVTTGQSLCGLDIASLKRAATGPPS